MPIGNKVKMRVLVTGCAGFVGQWVCKALLENDHEVIGLDRVKNSRIVEVPFYQVDILDQEALREVFRETKSDLVVHLAARTDLDEKKDINGYAANIDGVRHVLEAVKETESVRRVIITSSQLVCRVGYVPRDDLDYCPNTLYGQSKVLTEQITREMDGGGKEWCLTRPTTVWGPWMSPHYQKMLSLIEKGRFFHSGRGKLFKSYAYAGNIAYQYLRFLSAPREMIHGRTFYLADYEPLSLREYIDGLAAAMGEKKVPTIPLSLARVLGLVGDILILFGFARFPFNSFRLRNILAEYQFDMSQTKIVCGELPYSFVEGVRATAEWWQKGNRG